VVNNPPVEPLDIANERPLLIELKPTETNKNEEEKKEDPSKKAPESTNPVTIGVSLPKREKKAIGKEMIKSSANLEKGHE
jgi:hypothetical protein